VRKRGVRATSHTRKRVAKDTSSQLISHARSRLLWRRRRRRYIKGVTLLSKFTTKVRVKPHVRGASTWSKRMRGIKVLIVGIFLLKLSRRVALSFFRAWRGRSLIWVKCFLHLLHILLHLLQAFLSSCNLVAMTW
jgi:hypothetical protein